MSSRPSQGLRVVLALFGVLFLGVADNQTISPLLPSIQAQFGKTTPEMGLLFTGYSLCAGLSVLFWGPFSDIFGSKRGLTLGLIIFAAGSAVSFSASSFLLLLIGRVVTGMGASLLSLNTISYAADFFPYSSRGWAMGSIFSSYFAALILGVPAGSFLGDEFGWNAVFGLACCNALILLPLVGITLPRLAPRSVFSGAGRFAADQIRIFTGFLKGQKTAGALLSSFFASAGTMGFIAFVGVWLNGSFGVSGKEIGLVFLVSGAAALVVSPLAGALSDKIGKRVQFIFSNLALAALLFLLPNLGWGTVLFAIFGAISVAAAFRQGPMEALITEVVPAPSRGAFIALKNAWSQLGIAIAALLSGLLFSAWGYGAVCALCAISNLCAAGSMLFLVRERHL